MNDRWLFSKEAAEQRRDRAIESVDRGAPKDWKEQVAAVVACLAKHHDYFTTDRVWYMMPSDIVEDSEPRALGAIMVAAARDGLIVATDRWIPSVRVACHRRPLRVWKSLIRSENNV